MNRPIAVFGPTASGKSSLALRLAQEINGVIISVDSMQIYRGMDIGTAKPTREEQMLIPHKMIDICDPDEVFSVYDFKKMAEHEIRSAFNIGKTPILVGGTGLYFDAIFNNTDFGEFEISPDVRNTLEKRLADEGSSSLLKELITIDPEAGNKLHDKDHKRILRALEVYYSTGKTITQIQSDSRRVKSDFDFIKFHLVFRNRENLYKRINDRVDLMLKEGLVSEAKAAFENELMTKKTASQAIGYKELLPYFLGEKTMDACVDTLKQKTRNYAKRQITWFRRYTDAHELIIDSDADPLKTALNVIRNN